MPAQTRGAICHQTKKINLLLDSSMEAEAIGSSKCGELISYAREILRLLGVNLEQPTVLLTDNKANLLVATNTASATRSRHFLRRYVALQQRLAAGECQLIKVPDPHMPADFLTKWINREKLKQSVRYATNATSCVTPPP